MKYLGYTIEGEAAANWKSIYIECAKFERFIVEVRRYDEEREISLQQIGFFHAGIVPLFVNYTGDSKQYWENKLKLECGSKWFTPKEITISGHIYTVIPSKTNLSTKDFSEWYQNITDFGLQHGVVIPPPDPNWRLNKKQMEAKT